MKSKINQKSISDGMFKLKQESSQTGYLNFELAQTIYALNIQNIVNILEKPNLVYLSHMTPPIIGMQFYEQVFIPILDFAGYRPYNKDSKLLILSSNVFKKDHPFGLIVDAIGELQYIKQKQLIKNPYPFNSLLPSYYYSIYKKSPLNLLDIKDLENQID